MWNTLSNVYVCGSMWTHVKWYVLYMYYRYKKVKKCFTDQNMLNTVNTKSFHSICLSTSPLFVYHLSHETMKQAGWAEARSHCRIYVKQREWHAASVLLRRVKQATRWLSSFLFHPAVYWTQTEPKQILSVDVTSSTVERALSQGIGCVCVCECV